MENSVAARNRHGRTRGAEGVRAQTLLSDGDSHARHEHGSGPHCRRVGGNSNLHGAIARAVGTGHQAGELNIALRFPRASGRGGYRNNQITTASAHALGQLIVRDCEGACGRRGRSRGGAADGQQARTDEKQSRDTNTGEAREGRHGGPNSIRMDVPTVARAAGSGGSPRDGRRYAPRLKSRPPP